MNNYNNKNRKSLLLTRYIKHLAESANLKGGTFNKHHNGLIGNRFEMPNVSYTKPLCLIVKIAFMRTKIFAIIIFIVLGIAHVYGQTNKLYGYYGANDVRVNASFGLIPDEKFNNITPLTKIETDKILILTQFDNKVEITFKPFFLSDLPQKELTFSVSDYIDSLFKSSISNNQIEISFIENIDKEKLSIVTNKWNGELK